MTENNNKYFHEIHENERKRIIYDKSDFIDYVIMILICMTVVYFLYANSPIMQAVGIILSAFILLMFVRRNGVQLAVPVLLRKPQSIFYGIYYKLKNIKLPYYLAVGVLLLENYLIYLTPQLPHKVDLMREIGLYVFYLHFLLICLYRTVILVAHIRKKELAKEVLLQSAWKRIFVRQPSILVHIFHAYFTGLLTHMILVAPWFFIIQHVNFSIIFLPIVCVINIFVALKFARVVNKWFYREHWLGHNSEIEFVYFHGPHHDAIPSGLIGVAGNGMLEGVIRNTIAFPNPFFNPLVSCLLYTIEVKLDMDSHQYIPGIFPMLPREFHEVTQHSTHHFGKLEPYGFGIKIDQENISEEFKNSFKRLPDELKNSAKLDEQLTGFKWDNQRHEWFLGLIDKYQK